MRIPGTTFTDNDPCIKPDDFMPTLILQSDIKNTDFANFCWGWCMAKGLTADQAYKFYQAMIPLGFY